MRYAPIVLFIYNRPWHTRQTIEALQNNELASESELIIFSDGPKKDEPSLAVQQVRNYIRGVEGFKKVSIIERDTNLGLAKSIITGVTEVIEKHGKVIVLEDDMVSSRNFLEFMNRALIFYQDDKKIFSISGYARPIKIPKDYPHQVYLGYRGSSWGWGTWLDRWKAIDWEVKDLAHFKKDRQAQELFNLGGDDLSDMLINSLENKKDVWSIIHTYAQFKTGAFTLYPTVSKIENIGCDGSGVNCGVSIKWNVCLDQRETFTKLTKDLVVDEKINVRIRALFARDLRTRMGGLLWCVLRKLSEAPP